MNKCPVKFEVDTGSFLSTINIKELNGIPKVEINDTKVVAKGYSNNEINFVGETRLQFEYLGKKITHKFLVVDSNNVSLLGRDLCSQLKFELQIASCNNVIDEKQRILYKYKDYLSDKFRSCVQKTVRLPVKKDIMPIFSKPRPVPMRLKEKVQQELQRLEKAGVISRILASEYASPTVNVLKNDKNIRVCGDYSKINGSFDTAQFPLPSVDEVMANVSDAKIFSVIDLKSAFLISYD